MSEPGQPVFLVNVAGDPVRLVIRGRASYTNCAPVQQFMDRVLASGVGALHIDFAECTGMDSTFLGLLAGGALDMRRRTPPGEIVVTHLSARNLELIRNLGLHKLLKIGDPAAVSSDPVSAADLKPGAASQETILKAHEDLMRADAGNVAKFQDVVVFLKREAPPKP